MAHYQEVSVSGFEDFSRAVEQHKGKTIFAYFTGSKDAEGKSWCPDCVQGEVGIRGLLSRGSGRKAEGYGQRAELKRCRGGSLAPGDPQGDLSCYLTSFSNPVFLTSPSPFFTSLPPILGHLGALASSFAGSRGGVGGATSNC